MSAQDRLERVLRDMHILISKSESYSGDRIIVSKAEIFALIDRLNASIYEIMDEYELTKQSREKAERESRKRADKMVWDAQRKAEDVYAASILYTDEALTHLQTIMDEASEEILGVQQRMLDDLEEKRKTIKENQLELKSQLQDLIDTSKYLMLIEERNKEIQREKDLYKTKFGGQNEKEQFADVKTEIKINKEYFKEHGLEAPVDESDKDKKKDPDNKEGASAPGGKGKKAISPVPVNLDDVSDTDDGSEGEYEYPETTFSEEELRRMSEELDREFEAENMEDEGKHKKGLGLGALFGRK